jgi:hypothetical protein
MLEVCLGGELWTILRDRYVSTGSERKSASGHACAHSLHFVLLQDLCTLVALQDLSSFVALCSIVGLVLMMALQDSAQHVL